MGTFVSHQSRLQYVTFSRGATIGFVAGQRFDGSRNRLPVGVSSDGLECFAAVSRRWGVISGIMLITDNNHKPNVMLLASNYRV